MKKTLCFMVRDSIFYFIFCLLDFFFLVYGLLVFGMEVLKHAAKRIEADICIHVCTASLQRYLTRPILQRSLICSVQVDR